MRAGQAEGFWLGAGGAKQKRQCDAKRLKASIHIVSNGVDNANSFSAANRNHEVRDL